MCILLQYTFRECLHVAKIGTYTCYSACCANLKSFEECPKLKVTSQKLRTKSKKRPMLCGRCLEVFGGEWKIKGKGKDEVESKTDGEVEQEEEKMK